MEGRSHALSGVAIGLALAPVLGYEHLVTAAPLVQIVTGAAMVPDLDCGSSAVSRQFGWVSRQISNGLHNLSGWVYQRTKGPRDETWSGTHRHLTHTFVFALVIGALCAVLCLLSPFAAVPIYMVMSLLAIDRLGKPMMWLAGIGVLPLADILIHDPQLASWQIGVAVAVGCAIHDLGDSITLAGCPMLWPFPIKGETWYEIKPLGPLSFRTGGSVEHCLVFPLLLGATVWVGVPLAVPNAVPLLPQQVTSMALLLAVVVAVAVSTQRTVYHLRTRVLV